MVNININVYGVFHGEKLSKQLSKVFKVRLLTSYPLLYFSNHKPYNIYSNNLHYINYFFQKFIKSKILIVIVDRILRKIHYKLTKNKSLEGDILIFWANTSKEFISNVKKKSTKLILEKGNTHPIFRNQILSEEYKRLGVKYIESDSTITETNEFEFSDYIMVPSLFVRNTFITNGVDKNKIVVNPYGVNTDVFYNKQKNDSVFRIVFSGSACFRKGFHYLLDAVNKLDSNLKIECWHLGTIDPQMKKYLVNKNKTSISFKGSYKESELPNLYSQCSVLILPSLEEGLAMVTLQAMACGLPIICTPNTGLEDVISNGIEGFIVPIRNTEIIVEKIMYLYSNPNVHKKMSQNAFNRVRNGFTWDDYGKRYIEFLKSIENE